MQSKVCVCGGGVSNIRTDMTGFKTHQNRHDGVSVPPRSCPWCRQHLHFHRRSQTFSWMWQSTLMTKPVLCSRAGFLMHWKRQEKVEQRETVTLNYTNVDTKQRSGVLEQTLEAERGLASVCVTKRKFSLATGGNLSAWGFLFETFIIMR